MSLLDVAISIAGITFPVALIVLIGLWAVRTERFASEAIPHLARFATQYALPAALFSIIAVQDFSTLANGRFFLTYGLGTFLTMVVLFCVLTAAGRSLSHKGIALVGGTVCNCMMVGIPIAILLLEAKAVAVLGMVSFFQDALILPLALAIADFGQGKGVVGSLSATLRKSARNPLILAVIAGAIVAALPIEPPAFVLRTVELLAGALAGVGLFMIGGLLASKIPQRIGPLLPVFSAKLVVHPVLVGLCFFWIPADDPTYALAGILAASLPMVTLYSAFAIDYGDAENAAATTLVATVASFATVAVVMAVALRVF